MVFVFLYKSSKVKKKELQKKLGIDADTDIKVFRINSPIVIAELDDPQYSGRKYSAIVDCAGNELVPVTFMFDYAYESMCLLGDNPKTSLNNYVRISKEARNVLIMDAPKYLSPDFLNTDTKGISIDSNWIIDKAGDVKTMTPAEFDENSLIGQRVLIAYQYQLFVKLWTYAYETIMSERHLSAQHRNNISIAMQAKKQNGEHVGRPFGTSRTSEGKRLSLIYILENSKSFNGTKNDNELFGDEVGGGYSLPEGSYYRYKKVLTTELDNSGLSKEDYVEKKLRELKGNISQ